MRFCSSILVLFLALLLPALVVAQDPLPNPVPTPKPIPGDDHPTPPPPPVVRPGDDPIPAPRPDGERRRRGRGGAGLIERFDRNGDGVLDGDEIEGLPEGCVVVSAKPMPMVTEASAVQNLIACSVAVVLLVPMEMASAPIEVAPVAV